MKLAINMQNLSFHYEDAHPILKLDAFEVKNAGKDIHLWSQAGAERVPY